MLIPVFPDFYSLSLDDKEEYEKLISEFPPFSDILFATLHIWWNLDGKLGLSKINRNLVLNYSLPFDDKNSGYSIIGKNDIDQSINDVFAYLREEHRAQKLVHVPDFVVSEIKHIDNLSIEEEGDYHEYILDSQQVASLEGHNLARIRRKVNRFLREVAGKEVKLEVLDLEDPDVKKRIYDSIELWRPKRLAETDPEVLEMKALKQTLGHSSHLGIQNLALIIDGVLQGVVLYHLSPDKKHFVLTHLKVDYAIPFIFDYLTSQIAVKAVSEGAPYLNMEMDLGIEGLRKHKMGLKPINFFKKYTISQK